MNTYPFRKILNPISLDNVTKEEIERCVIISTFLNENLHTEREIFIIKLMSIGW